MPVIKFIFVLSFRKYLLKRYLKKRRRHLVTNRIRENNLIEHNKKTLLNGEIILTHCRGHDTILIFFRSEGFHEQNIRLLSRSYGFE